jgi:colicin import membrane protein
MTLAPFNSWKGPSKEGLWMKVVSLSIGMHLLILAFFLNIFPHGRVARSLEPAYVVDLVSSIGEGPVGKKMNESSALPAPLPDRSEPQPPISKKSPEVKKEEPKILKQAVEPKPIPLPKPIPEKPLSIKEDRSKNLEQAMEQLKKKVQQEKTLKSTLTHLEKQVQQEKSLEKTLNRLEKKVQGEQARGNTAAQMENKRHPSTQSGTEPSPGGSGSIASSVPGVQDGVGIQFQLYNASLRSQIKKNWGLPEELLKRNDMSAEILIRIGRNGHIEDSRFQRKSGVEAFDQEVLRTLKKSDPLPPLPEGYPKSSYDVILTFHSKELSGK